MAQQGITPREKDYSQWYLDVIAAGELVDQSPVRGCMVIKPHGYGIWEASKPTSMHDSRPPGTLTPTSHCLSLSLSCRKRPTMSKASPRNAQS